MAHQRTQNRDFDYLFRYRLHQYLLAITFEPACGIVSSGEGGQVSVWLRSPVKRRLALDPLREQGSRHGEFAQFRLDKPHQRGCITEARQICPRQNH